MILVLSSPTTANSISHLREGGIVRAPTALAFGNVTLEGNGNWRANPHFPSGPNVFYNDGEFIRLKVSSSSSTSSSWAAIIAHIARREDCMHMV